MLRRVARRRRWVDSAPRLHESDVFSQIEADVVLVAIGRRPNTKGLGLENIGVEKDKRGRIIIDDQFNTSAKGVKCVGDVTFGPMLAHKAEEEGESPFPSTLDLVLSRRSHRRSRDHKDRPRTCQLRCDPLGRVHTSRSRLGREE